MTARIAGFWANHSASLVFSVSSYPWFAFSGDGDICSNERPSRSHAGELEIACVLAYPRRSILIPGGATGVRPRRTLAPMGGFQGGQSLLPFCYHFATKPS